MQLVVSSARAREATYVPMIKQMPTYRFLLVFTVTDRYDFLAPLWPSRRERAEIIDPYEVVSRVSPAARRAEGADPQLLKISQTISPFWLRRGRPDLVGCNAHALGAWLKI